jgi:Eukaryotic cytochrome b561
LTALIWAGIFLHPPLSLFSAHPLLNSSAILFLTESILILQPTHTAAQKRHGTLVHFFTNMVAFDLLIAAFVIIEYNKFNHDAVHFDSVHGKLGLTTYILLLIQSTVGFTQYFVPQLYRGVNNAKSIYKWHRLSGYVILVMMLATVCAATQTDTGGIILDIKLWAVLVSSVLILIGVLPRIKKQKFALVPKSSGAFGQ